MGNLVRADAGDIAHVILKKPELGGAESIKEVLQTPRRIHQDKRDPKRLLYRKTIEQTWGPVTMVAIVHPTQDGWRLKTVLAPDEAYWKRNAGKEVWPGASATRFGFLSKGPRRSSSDD